MRDDIFKLAGIFSSAIAGIILIYMVLGGVVHEDTAVVAMILSGLMFWLSGVQSRELFS